MPPTASGPAVAPGRSVRPGPARGRRLLLVCAAVLAAALSLSPPARAETDDATPTPWQLQAGTAGLLTAPPPPEPVTICVIDTGVTPTPDLTITARSSTLPGTLDDVTAKPGHFGHGTTVAHFAAAAVNGWGGSGAFPAARISSVRVFPEEGGTTWQDYITALDRCHRIDAATRVALISLGGDSMDAKEADELDNRIRTAKNTYGLNVVVSAGNGGGPPDYPGRFETAFTVAAVDAGGSLCPFSARGPGIDLAAPGCGLAQAGYDGSTWTFDGTSYAAPVVAGVLAALRAYRPDLEPEEAEAMFKRSATPGVVPVIAAGTTLASAGVPEFALPPQNTDLPPSGQLPKPAPDHLSQAIPRVDTPAGSISSAVAVKTNQRSLLGPIVRPRVTVRKHSRSLRLTVLNMPDVGSWELRVGRRRWLRPVRTLTMRAPRKRQIGRARLRVKGRQGPWERLSLPAR